MKPSAEPPADGSDDTPVVVLSSASRGLRRQLRPLAWMTLEEVAMDAVVEEGRLVARTSSRRLAERLGVDPGTVATALRALRQRGLLALQRESGPSGRFGLSVYVLANVAGLSVLVPGGDRPCVECPRLAGPSLDTPNTAEPHNAAIRTDLPRVDERNVVELTEPGTDDAHHVDGFVKPPRPSFPSGAQEALDLGLGSA